MKRRNIRGPRSWHYLLLAMATVGAGTLVVLAL
ncbi:hypothetical protein ATJ78_1598 [Paramicrobacterium agarici]|uniref:Uncharacterized protein n=1 Tax=Paramicrobacterium agarici TaxID=630514 RepID=A0A2A9DVN4_9MICO|nr:hypothetical protein ATJ78_1598 [Microbacterium agarici]